MQLCFLMEKRYAPYPKWFGTAFAELKCATQFTPILRRVQTGDTYRQREKSLAEAYTISTHATQLTIIQTLAQFEFPFAYKIFIQALKSPDPLIRQTAIAGLGELGDSRGLLVMRTHLLQDSDVGVRAEAAFRLGKLGGPADEPALRQARETDPTPTVHFWATWSLNQIAEET